MLILFKHHIDILTANNRCKPMHVKVSHSSCYTLTFPELNCVFKTDYFNFFLCSPVISDDRTRGKGCKAEVHTGGSM